MAAAWQQQRGDARAAELGFDDRFTLLVEAEQLEAGRFPLQEVVLVPGLAVGGENPGHATTRASSSTISGSNWVPAPLSMIFRIKSCSIRLR